MSRASSGAFEDIRIGVRLKLSALWVAMLFLFAYGDIFGFFAPGHIEDIMAGEIGGFDLTQGFLFAISLYVAIASVMVFLSLVLAPPIARWTNLVLAVLYLISIAASAIGEDVYFMFLSLVEAALLVLIARYAWSWPRESDAR